jgi:hypothetical protein
MTKILGERASRLEVYALFVAAVVLIGGGIGGAIFLTDDSPGSSNSAPATVASTLQPATTTTAVRTTSTAGVPNQFGSTSQLTETQKRVRSLYATYCTALETQESEFENPNAGIPWDGTLFVFYSNALRSGLFSFEIEDAIDGACPLAVANMKRVARIKCSRHTWDQNACRFESTAGLIPAPYATR